MTFVDPVDPDQGAPGDGPGAQTAAAKSDPGPQAGSEASRADVLAHLARILDSREFRTARNRARFLEYVVTRTLDGAEQGLKEYTLGVDVFDRGTSFDPRTDGVVRTQAGLVRKHLERYYATEGQDEAIEIVLPKGHYVPLIQRRENAAAREHGATGTNGATGTSPANSANHATAGTNAVNTANTATNIATNSATNRVTNALTSRVPGGRWLWIGVAAALAVVAILAAGAARIAGGAARANAARTSGGDAIATGTTDARPEIVGAPIWAAFLAPGASNVLAFGIPQFFSNRDGVWVRDVEVNKSTTTFPSGSHLDTIRRHLGGGLQPAEAYTGIGEAYGVFLLSRFFLGRTHAIASPSSPSTSTSTSTSPSTGHQAAGVGDPAATRLRVVRSPTLNWDDLKHDNVIFLTSARFRTLADQLSYPADFVHVVGSPNRVMNVHPASGEEPEYVARMSGTVGVDHAIISLWPGKRAGRRVLVLSGGHTWGTQAAAEYVTEPDYLRELHEHLLACQRRQGLSRHADFFQVLLRVEIRENQPIGVRYVTHHDLAIGETGDPTTAPQRAALSPRPR